MFRQSGVFPDDALLVAYRRESSTDKLRAHCVSSSEHTWIRGVSIALGDGVSGCVGANERSALNADPLPYFQEAANDARGFRSCVSVPVQCDGLLVGVLSVYSVRPSAFTERSRLLVESLAEEITPELHPSPTATRRSLVQV